MKLRSRAWFDNPDNADMTAIYVGHYLNYGLTLEELQSGKPIIGIAQTGSDLSPCNRHHIELARRVRSGIEAAGGLCFEFPVHPIQENGKRPTAALDRNLTYLGLVECLHGYPLDGVVLTIGCDKTTPALLMGAATVNIPAIAFSVGPMLNGWHNGKRAGTGTTIWAARQKMATGEIGYDAFMDVATASIPSVGFCNTMGTATTMNSLAEALGMQLPGAAAIPAPYRARGQMAYRTGQRIVDLVREDVKPSDIMTRGAFENAVVVNSALGGSTNAPIHLNAVARHMGVALSNDDWQDLGHDIPLLTNLQPAGDYLGEDFFHAGGVPAVVSELIRAGRLPTPEALTVSGATIAENCATETIRDTDVIRPFETPLKPAAGFYNLSGNLFDSAILKTSVISDSFRQRYLSNAEHPGVVDLRAIVFDGPEDYHARIEDPALKIDQNCLLVIRGAGPLGHPGGAEVVNMQPPAYLIRRGITELPTLGDGRQSGTSGSPSILNASPEAAAGGNLALLRTNDLVQIDLPNRKVNMLVGDDEIAARRAELEAAGGYRYPASQTPWQMLQRRIVGQFDGGMVIEEATGFQRVAQTMGLPRDNH